eukprot:CAMPEP_0114302900 /NCGR_PEP_ID=MMETSP0059-20121206/14917_1 /TAXON_ID=36894 /ORGANISM="Pyramimonas parkeae, Strain CCMP726" /LENGTH=46 /DNA_ID= /DNA_START= /DNA_END= /DNA_ORIENTATION=
MSIKKNVSVAGSLGKCIFLNPQSIQLHDVSSSSHMTLDGQLMDGNS